MGRMGGKDGFRLALWLVGLIVVLGGAAILKGGFYIGKHEGDTLHMVQMVLRMAGGDWPHLDFVTPIGVLAMAPIAWLVSLGMGVGHAILWSQVVVAVLLLPATWYVARTRFDGLLAFAFAGIVMVLTLALVHGEAERAVSISMHYNRWAWAVTFVVLAAAMLGSRAENKTLDGVIIGVGMAALVLLKFTYALAFFPAVLVALIQRGQGRAIWVGLLSAVIVFALVTLAAGTPLFWVAYLRDLATVASSPVRPQPGLPFGAVVGAPAYMAGSLALVLSVIWLRQSGRKVEGLVMLLLVPAFFYVTYQNFGNDPQWLPLVALILLVLVPAQGFRNAFGWDMRRVVTYTAVIMLALGAPSVINLAYSPFRHLIEDSDKYTSLLPGSGANDDIVTPTIRAHRVDAKIALDGPESPYSAFWEADFREGEDTEWRGETLANCTVELGTVAWFKTIADDLNARGLADGKTAFVADILNGFWLYGAFEPLEGNAPWYYGGLSGFANADYLLVPLCPLSTSVRKQILGEIEGVPAHDDEDGNAVPAVEGIDADLTEVERNALYILYEIGEIRQ
ncbi:glycosyltransferase family 87 protein [Maritimibacter sp. DP1N21-5]|uniref:glycosyltransferase family 87 protein n=1 Tax=Maritimibacter sp. DP1N21-5 TaxID=2836867 RepID=UPI001C4576F3|nr:glycosyltransferase family 87 protein [Maritimibacter sp. DP1N21-5]MBV7409238.1 DUF2029 domain-containing protein [Maritimibacter sp. DP1N21-5]